MKKLVLSFCIFLFTTSIAYADVVRIETNDWDFPRKLTWTARLLTLNPETGIARFQYRNRGRNVEFRVHVSRIYSLTIDERFVLNKDFPLTRANLTESLSTKPRASRSIRLQNRFGLTSGRIPDSIIVRPNRENHEITIFGAVNGISDTGMDVSVLNTQSEFIEVIFDRNSLIQWIR